MTGLKITDLNNYVSGDNYIDDVLLIVDVVKDESSKISIGVLKNILGISSIEFSNILNKPTTISGYGITDSYTASQIDQLFLAYAPNLTYASATTSGLLYSTDWNTFNNKIGLYGDYNINISSDNSNIIAEDSNHTFTMGMNNNLMYNNSGTITTGYGNKVYDADNSLISGSNNKVCGANSIIKGYNNILGDWTDPALPTRIDGCVLIGNSNQVSMDAPFSLLLGSHLKATNASIASVWFGQYNDNSNSNIIFGFGNGISDTSRSNLFEFYNNGVIKTNVDVFDITDAKHLVTKEYVENTTHTYTKPQIGLVTSLTSLTFDLGLTNNFKTTISASGTLTFSNLVSGQSGSIILINNNNYIISKSSTVKTNTTFLDTISFTGTYWISYICDGTNVYLSTTGILS